MVAILRVVATLLAALWAVFPGFGLIDLSLLLFPNEYFAQVLPLEVSWGAFITLFLVVPLATTAVRPAAFWGAVCLGLIAVVAVGAGAALTAYPPAMLLAAAAALTSAVTLALGLVCVRRGRITVTTPWFGVHWLLLPLAVVGTLLWVPYAIHAARAFDVLVSDVTMGIDHWPVQAAAGVAIMLGSFAAAFVPRIRLSAVVAVSFCAAVIGVSAVQGVETAAATETAFWGAWCVLWGTAVALSANARRGHVAPTKTAGPPEGGPAVVNRSD